jgi:hypothetical protein
MDDEEETNTLGLLAPLSLSSQLASISSSNLASMPSASAGIGTALIPKGIV